MKGDEVAVAVEMMPGYDDDMDDDGDNDEGDLSGMKDWNVNVEENQSLHYISLDLIWCW